MKRVATAAVCGVITALVLYGCISSRLLVLSWVPQLISHRDVCGEYLSLRFSLQSVRLLQS